ncbi:unnamed protein product [Paramecium octaurelia]|uniref:CSC1/OSCA1-like cytosolic domain-containing protein n=1 Tax=Paramecium octaurelia TaxID=43137 RepID=A0A8S1VTD7_PAROT|nr:unnamed protein product [Paramecium octaurelia]
MEQPPESIFAPIDNCFDHSIVYYFRILKWNFFLMLIFAVLHLPQLIFCITGNSIFNQFQLQLETFTVANLDISNETAFLIGVLGDAIGTLLYFLSLLYLRYNAINKDAQFKVSSISPWSVEVNGFPSATIDPEDLRSILQSNTHEIYLVRNFQGTLSIMKNKAFKERQIRLEKKKLEVFSKRLSQADMYVRQDFIRVLTDELKDITKELADKFNIFLAPDDLESIKAFVVFKSKVDRDLFYEKYNQDCLVRNGIYLFLNQPQELKLRGLYTIKVTEAPDPNEIKWENMDYQERNNVQIILMHLVVAIILLAPLIVFENMALKNARNNTVKCTEYCLDSDFTRTAYYIITGFWIFVADILGWIFLELIINKEKQIYLVQEQKVILIRIIVYLTCYTLLVPILISWETIGNIVLVVQSYTSTEKSLIFSDDLDRKWIINHGLIFLWVSIFYTLKLIILSIASGCRCITGGIRDQEELQLIGSLLTDENDEERQRLTGQQKTTGNNTNNNNQSHQTLFLLNLDESVNYNIQSRQNLDIKTGKTFRRDSPLINSNPTFRTGLRYAKLLFSIFLSTIVSAGLPLLPLLGAIQIGLQYVYDKNMLLKYHSYNEKQQVKLQEQLKSVGIITLKFIHFFLVLHLIFSVLIYGYPYIYTQNGMGISQDWNDSSNKLLYKLSTVIPLTLLFVILVVALIIDLVFFGINNNWKIQSDQIGQDVSQNLEDHVAMLKEQGSAVSYNLKHHDEFRDILLSQKQESIRATLNQFKH